MTVTPLGKRYRLADLLAYELGGEPTVYDAFHCKLDRVEFAFSHTHAYGETYFSFVNGQYTSDGGTHQSAFREGLLKAINEFSKKKKYSGDDVREGMVGAIAVRLKDPIFESQTKHKLGNTEIRADLVARVRDVVVDLLHRNPKQAEKLVNKIRTGRGFSLEDFKSQLEQMQNMGGMGSLVDKMPGMAELPDQVKNRVNDRQTVSMIAIINSMTPQERRFPDVIRGSRKKRIALGSGTKIQDINRMLKQYSQMQRMMKKMGSKGGMANMMRGLKGNLPPGFPM